MSKLLIFPLIFLFSGCIEKTLDGNQKLDTASCRYYFEEQLSLGVDISQNFSVDNVSLEVLTYETTCPEDIDEIEAFDNISRVDQELLFTFDGSTSAYPLEEDHSIPLVGYTRELSATCSLKYLAEGILRENEQDLIMVKEYTLTGSGCF